MPIILPSSITTTSVTAGDIVVGALRLLRVYSLDVTLSSDDMQIGLSVLNQMLDGWATEGLTLNQVVRESFAVTAGHNPHTWGTGGDFNSARPVEIMQASFTIGTTPSVDIPVPIVSYDDYEAVRLKGLVTNYPQLVYPDYNYPLCNVYSYPISSGGTFNFMSYKAMSQFSYPETVVSLPPGYVRTLRYCLAVELAPEYQVDPGQTVVQTANVAMTKLKTLNYKPTTAQVDPALVRIGRGGGRYNPWSDSRS